MFRQNLKKGSTDTEKKRVCTYIREVGGINFDKFYCET